MAVWLVAQENFLPFLLFVIESFIRDEMIYLYSHSSHVVVHYPI